MQQIVRYMLPGLFFMHGVSYALNPYPGFYAGIILGGSYSPDTTITFSEPAAQTPACPFNLCLPNRKGDLSYSGYGNIGGQIGYRFSGFRVELEPVVNYNPYQDITVGNTLYRSPKSSTGVRLKGSTTTAMLMFNGYYDFFTFCESWNLVPYAGAGVGYAYIKNDIEFYCNNKSIPCTNISDSTSTTALQGILGLGYHLDDFTWFGLDYRYIATGHSDMLDSNVQVHTINLSFNGSLCL
ncbi:outer membrane protein [Legionella londiniensis]|uniref:Opacity protein-like surface antigen n=1 Tax=Legionella londiniensis TaxID=45068 RepID=A0A0W0VKV6_9GAMM|nr:outer membrane beta-barrel protein [Legionella londiniensis]KTD20740.1 opacity protein-like surface antigen [Legionella londiniensis]STX92787.1 opacity protein-like surface antigen [Legionella londiniensis]